MVSREVVELDFFGMEKEKRYKSTINDIQRAISKINPQLIHHVITSTSIPGLSLPVLVPESRFDSETSLPGTAPLTMFYNGKVMVFDLSNDKATNIMRMAGEAAVPKCVSNTTNSMLGNFTGELPMARKKSLQRFLAKRKARITGPDPYKMELQPYMMKRQVRLSALNCKPNGGYEAWLELKRTQILGVFMLTEKRMNLSTNLQIGVKPWCRF